MTLKILRSSDPVRVEQLVVCIYSQPGLGKTSLGFTSAAPLDVDFDHGIHRAANRKDSVPVSSWDEVMQITAEDLANYKTVIVDTAGRALDFLSAYIINENPKMGGPNGLSQPGWGKLKLSFGNWLKNLRVQGKDVVLLAHMDEQRSGDEYVERLDVQGGSKAEIYKSSDAMGRIMIDPKGQRFLDFNPRSNSFGKNPCQLDLIPFPSPTKDPDTLAKVIATIKERLNQMSAEQQEAEREIEEWRMALEDFSTVDDFNKMMPEFKKASVIIKGMVNKKARSLGFVYNKSAGLYEAGQEQRA